MPRQKRQESPTGIYHVMQRGVGKHIIFEDYEDYRFYKKKLSEYITMFDVEIFAYCLMENHVHLLISATSERNISQLLHRLGSSYAMYYNKKYSHTGHVFQGRYGCEIVGDEKYLLTCVRYIHNNPAKALISTRESYKWSSYREYVLDKGITERQAVMSLIGTINQFVEFSMLNDDTEVMDCVSRNLSINDGIEYIRRKCGDNIEDGTVVGRLCKEDRDAILRELKEQGFSVKQIERITGISRTIIYRA